MRHLRDKRGSDSVKKSWRKVVDRDRTAPHAAHTAHGAHGIPVLLAPYKPEDSGYLSTDSNESKRRLSLGLGGMALKGQGLGLTGLGQGQGSLRGSLRGSLSETDGDESICDGASESGGESVATDSFFFGSFRGGGSSDRRRSSHSGGHGSGHTSRRSSVVLVSQ